VPFAVPLLIRSGAISTIIIRPAGPELGPAGTAGHGGHQRCGTSHLVCFADRTHQPVLGRVGITIVCVSVGHSPVCSAIQFILAGLGEAIPGMFNLAVTAPYPSGGHWARA
jgi:multiple antibiotic resistance protein